MLKITNLTVEKLEENCITDNPNPKISFALESDGEGVFLKKATIRIGDWQTETVDQINNVYNGAPLAPYSEYRVTVIAESNTGDTAERSATFKTGKMADGWQAKWITDGDYIFKEKKTSPKPMTFRKKIGIIKPVKSATVYSTAVGIYNLYFNDKKIGRDYFAPGFTSYKNRLQYQVYDVTEYLVGGGSLIAVVGGGWAVGSFTHKRLNRIYARRQALLLELRITYEDGTAEIIGTDESWQVTEEGNFRFAEFYDGEIYDATVDLLSAGWKSAKTEKVGFKNITASYGCPVRSHEEFKPVNVFKSGSGEIVYDFGQNFSGVIKAEFCAKKGTKLVFRHSEILQNGELFTEALRSAKATVTYIAKEGRQSYSPSMTYMGFRYVGVSGIEEKDLELSALAIYSDMPVVGKFACSDERLNRLHDNVVWSAKSNFMDIPTDCPQRDERMGWTGDIAVFSSTAVFNFDTSRFFDKWLKDMRSDQGRSGGIPVIVPHIAIPGQFETMFKFPIDYWGDSCILVPWAEYRARGDVAVLRQNYPMMKKYLKACKRLAEAFSFGKRRRIWKFHHYGDWCAPDGNWKIWMGRGKWTATACLCNSSEIVAEIAGILGEEEDEKYFRRLSSETADAFRSVLTDGNGKLKNEFQTAYVLPVYYGIFEGKEKENALKNLVCLVKNGGYGIGTGFPGTPYVLFALADNGYSDEAYKMLLNESCPSWLYEVKAGATTIWERWDALKEDGSFNNKDAGDVMVSFNHYAGGAVGDFLYRRVLGLEAAAGGYKEFKVKPVLCREITSASGETDTPYGKIKAEWKTENGVFEINVKVPVGTRCLLTLPSGKEKILNSGNFNLREEYD
ncbi:MAG: family 78 glycoside hydrolase catalytic domain [Clostridia bacterium]|nr:family 78 glycoside hydrolase catalytic domain [Clostridia bacterium]